MTREEALQAIKARMDYYESNKRLRCAIETLIPELAESEDERIRKELVEAFEALDIDSSWNGIPVKSILAWLEDQKPTEWSEEDEKMLNLTKTQLRILQSHLSHAHSESMSDMEYSSQSLQIEKCVSWLDIHFKSLHSQPMNIIKIDELEDFIDTELHKDEFIRRWPQYAFNVPEHKEGDEYSVGVAVGVGRIINKLRNFIVNKKA